MVLVFCQPPAGAVFYHFSGGSATLEPAIALHILVILKPVADSSFLAPNLRVFSFSGCLQRHSDNIFAEKFPTVNVEIVLTHDLLLEPNGGLSD